LINFSSKFPFPKDKPLAKIESIVAAPKAKFCGNGA